MQVFYNMDRQNTPNGVLVIQKVNIKQAKDEVDLISRDGTLRWLTLRAEITRMYNEQYIIDAKENGARSKSVEIAKRLLSKGLSLDEIVEITGLSLDEIKKL